MSYYAQTNYQQLQGKTVNGVHPCYTIHDIGCFITAFCNLEARFGSPIAPDALDNALAARNLYIDVDDGVYDDVGWSTLCAYDPSISISATGVGAPTSSDSIVKFIYNSFQTGKPTTHFCLVLDAKAGTIIDSWDGQVKSWNAYPGGPKEWASYAKAKPQPVTPPNITHAQLDQLYADLLHRTPDAGAYSHYVGNYTYTFVENDIKHSAEYIADQAPKETPSEPTPPVTPTPPATPVEPSEPETSTPASDEVNPPETPAQVDTPQKPTTTPETPAPPKVIVPEPHTYFTLWQLFVALLKRLFGVK